MAALVAQAMKNLPAMQETWVQSLGWEDALEEDMATHSSIVAWRIPMDRGVRHDWVTKNSTASPPDHHAGTVLSYILPELGQMEGLWD